MGAKASNRDLQGIRIVCGPWEKQGQDHFLHLENLKHVMQRLRGTRVWGRDKVVIHSFKTLQFMRCTGGSRERQVSITVMGICNG